MLRTSERFLLVALLIAFVSCSPRGQAPSAPGSTSATTPSESLLRFAAVGDIGDGSANESAVAAAITREHERDPLDLLLLLGDLIYPNGNPAEYAEKFAVPYREIIKAGIETKAVLGNHDIETDPDGMIVAFKMDSRYYSFERQGVVFPALDTSRGTIDATQRSWLDKELVGLSPPLKLAFTHMPMYSSGIHGPTLAVRESSEDLFVNNGVQLVISAHDHNYERTTPIRGIVHVTVGTGCCPRPGPMFTNQFTSAFRVGLGFLVGELTTKGIELRWIDAEGSVLDSATVATRQGKAA